MKKNKLVTSGKNWVEKRNIVNEMKVYSFGLEELRIFNTYLSKINARDSATRLVRFTVSYFQKLMNIDSIKISQLEAVADKLLQRIVTIRNYESGGSTKFQLFKRCKIEKDVNGEWYMDIDAHDESLPLLFDFKEKFLTYNLENLAGLKSGNQIRMYEILKQYENTGYRIVTLAELKEYVGILPTEYTQYKFLKRDVIEPCKKAITENTDITFTYEPYTKKGRKIDSLKFSISKNENVSQSQADEISVEPRDTFVDEAISAVRTEPRGVLADETASAVVYVEPQMIEQEVWAEKRTYTCVNDYDDETLGYLAQACEFSFDESEMGEIKAYIDIICPLNPYNDESEQLLGLKPLYNELKRQEERTKIKNRFKYFAGILKKISDKEKMERNKRLVKAMRDFE